MALTGLWSGSDVTSCRGSSYGNGATVIEELEPEPIVQSTKALKTDRGKENHAAMHTYDHSKAKWDSFNAEEAEAAPSSQPAKAAPSSKAADGFLKARETTRKPQQAPLPPVRQPPQADNSAEGHKNRGNELFRKAQYDKALEAYTRQGLTLLLQTLHDAALLSAMTATVRSICCASQQLVPCAAVHCCPACHHNLRLAWHSALTHHTLAQEHRAAAWLRGSCQPCHGLPEAGPLQGG